MPIDDSFRPNKSACYAPDLIPDLIYVDSGNSVSAFTTPYNSHKAIFLISDNIDTDHIIIRDKPSCPMEKIVYWSRLHDGIRCYKNSCSIDLSVLFIRGFITIKTIPYTIWS